MPFQLLVRIQLLFISRLRFVQCFRGLSFDILRVRDFRRQHLELFLPGLRKLALEDLPPAVACAQYHYLSNALGGVKVEWIAESDTKSWVRYLPPRWIRWKRSRMGQPMSTQKSGSNSRFSLIPSFAYPRGLHTTRVAPTT